MERINYGNVVFLGDVGKGKTSLCRVVLDETVGKAASTECAGGATSIVGKYEGRWRSKKDAPKITVFDMPGFGDTNVKFPKLMEQWKEEIQGQSFTAICFVVRLDDHRLTAYQQIALKVIKECMEKTQSLGNIILIGTHADKLDPDEDGTAEVRISNILEEINKMIKEEIEKLTEEEIKKMNKEEAKVKRTVCISLRKSKPELMNKGLEELEKHLNELVGSPTKIKDKLPKVKDLEEIAIKTGYTGEKCFDGEMIVRLLKGDKVVHCKLTDIKLFDMIQVNGGSFEPVMILSRHINQPATILDFEIQAKEGERKIHLRLVPSHFMYVKRGNQIIHILARKVRMDDKLLYFSDNETVVDMPITNISTNICKDLINVRTKSRTAIVNDFCCSSVVEGDAGTVGHWIAMAGGKIHKELPNEMKKLAVMLQSAYSRFKNPKI